MSWTVDGIASAQRAASLGLRIASHDPGDGVRFRVYGEHLGERDYHSLTSSQCRYARNPLELAKLLDGVELALIVSAH